WQCRQAATRAGRMPGRSRIGKLQDRFEALVGDTEPRDVAGPVAAATHRAVAVRAEERRQPDREAHRAAEATAPGRTACARYGRPAPGAGAISWVAFFPTLSVSVPPTCRPYRFARSFRTMPHGRGSASSVSPNA